MRREAMEEEGSNACIFLDLPNELLLYIFSLLRPAELFSCERVCHFFRDFVGSEDFWKV